MTAMPPGATSISTKNKKSIKIALEQGSVLIVGPDALTVRYKDPSLPQESRFFYELVAQQWLEIEIEEANLADSEAPSLAWDLHRATAKVFRVGNEDAAATLRLKEVIQELSEKVELTGALKELAKLKCFDLIVSLTPDSLFLDEILAVRRREDSTFEIKVASYTPGTGLGVDIEVSQPGRMQMHFLLGRVDREAPNDFAIHEESTLECLYQMQDRDESRVRNLLDTLRQQHLFFFGTGLPDWFGRNLLRFISRLRLSIPDDKNLTYFCTQVRDPALKEFIKRFSKGSTMLDMDPDSFVSELAELAKQAKRPEAAAPTSPSNGLAAPTVSGAAGGTGPSVFVSYASQDLAAAIQIVEALKHAGFGNIWFDKEQLQWGDFWGHRLENAIDTCDYFIPLVSANAERRFAGEGGEFIREWKGAFERSGTMGRKFILPVGIDADLPTAAVYPTIAGGDFKLFWKLQLLHAPLGRFEGSELAGLQEFARVTIKK